VSPRAASLKKKPRRQAAPRFVVARTSAPTNGDSPEAAAPRAELVPAGEWREFVGRWLEIASCTVSDAARGDWEVGLSAPLQKRWRRQRVRLVFDPLRATLPRGAWFTAPGSSAGRKILEAAREEPIVTRRTALPHVPGAPDDGFASVCRTRGLEWGTPRLGPVRYERRVAFHAVVTLWGGLPAQEPWILLIGPNGELIEHHRETELPEVRGRDGLYQIEDDLTAEECDRLAQSARGHLDAMLADREGEWERSVGRLRDDELARLSAFFAARVEEEEERARRRVPNPDGPELEDVGDTTSLKLEWDRRAHEVRQRWALRTEVRLWGLEEWAWPLTEIEQEVRAGAVHRKLTGSVDVARGRPALPACPSCGTPADMLVRMKGTIACVACGPR